MKDIAVRQVRAIAYGRAMADMNHGRELFYLKSRGLVAQNGPGQPTGPYFTINTKFHHTVKLRFFGQFKDDGNSGRRSKGRA